MHPASSNRPAFELCNSLRRRGITDERVLETITRVPRDRFVPDDVRQAAWQDDALPIDCGQTISQPYIVALMTQELGLDGSERVLEIGTGSGYQTAILAELCRDVVTVERIGALSQAAESVLGELGYRNISFDVGDGTLGCSDVRTFDAIMVTAAAPRMPAPLFNQLTPVTPETPVGGRIIVPIGDRGMQTLRLVRRTSGGFEERDLCGCRFVPLIGEAGWPVDVG